jgi:putative transcriptional regulator
MSTNPPSVQIRQALIDARKARGMTQQQFADAVGITRSFLANLESCKYEPSLRVAYRISRLTGKRVEELFPPQTPNTIKA